MLGPWSCLVRRDAVVAELHGAGRMSGSNGESADRGGIELVWPGKYTADGTRATAPPLRVRPCFEVRERVGAEDAASNRLILGENRLVMEALLAEPSPPQIDLIYLDPPFAVQTTHSARVSLENEGGAERAEVPAYADRFVPEVYLEMMATRLELARKLLAPQGLLFLHCDTRASAWLRLLLDEIFSRKRFLNEIIWHYRSGGRPRDGRFAAKHDTILVYAKSKDWHLDASAVGERRGAAKRNNMKRDVDETGRSTFSIRSGNRVYTYAEDERMSAADVWTDISHLHQRDPQRSGYPTQKPEALLERIILAASRPGDLVADFFCGSGTAGVVAQRHGRRFLLSDLSELAIYTTRNRLLATTPEAAFEVATLGHGEAQQFRAEHPGNAESFRDALLTTCGLNRAETPPAHGTLADGTPVLVAESTELAQPELEALVARMGNAERVVVLAWQFSDEARAFAAQTAHVVLGRIPRSVLLPSRPPSPLVWSVPALTAEAHYCAQRRRLEVRLESYELELLAGPARLAQQVRNAAHFNPLAHLAQCGVVEDAHAPRRIVASSEQASFDVPWPAEAAVPHTLHVQTISRFGDCDVHPVPVHVENASA